MKKYYYSNGKERRGPFNFEELKHEDINKNSLVWFEGLADWTSADEIPELKEIFELIPPPIDMTEPPSNLENDTLGNLPKEIVITNEDTGNNMASRSRMFADPFSFYGRIRRLEYGLSCIIYFIIYFLILMLANLSIYKSSIPTFLTFPLHWFLLAQGSKRSHDTGNSGWFQLIPFYILWLLFAKSQKYANKYGDNPKM